MDEIARRNEIVLGMRRFIGQQAAKWKTHADIDDLIQAGILAVLVHWPTYNPARTKPLTYFGRIISNEIRKYAIQKLIRVPESTIYAARKGKGKPATRERVTMATGRYISLSSDTVEI